MLGHLLRADAVADRLLVRPDDADDVGVGAPHDVVGGADERRDLRGELDDQVVPAVGLVRHPAPLSSVAVRVAGHPVAHREPDRSTSRPVAGRGSPWISASCSTGTRAPPTSSSTGIAYGFGVMATGSSPRLCLSSTSEHRRWMRSDHAFPRADGRPGPFAAGPERPALRVADWAHEWVDAGDELRPQRYPGET